DLVHGSAEREAATAAAAALFGRGDLSELPGTTLEAALREAGAGEVELPVSLVDAFVAAVLVDSKSAARRAIAEGGAWLNNTRVEDAERVLEPSDLVAGRFAVLRRGRRNVSGVMVTDRS